MYFVRVRDPGVYYPFGDMTPRLSSRVQSRIGYVGDDVAPFEKVSKPYPLPSPVPALVPDVVLETLATPSVEVLPLPSLSTIGYSVKLQD